MIDSKPICRIDGDHYLFCSSNFLVHEVDGAPALDWEVNEILDDESNPVSITVVPVYAETLDADADNNT